MAIAGYSFGGWIASGGVLPARACLAISSPELQGTALPVLAITGELDDIAPGARLRPAVEQLGGELVVVAGADHFWGQGLDQAVERGVAFLREHLEA